MKAVILAGGLGSRLKPFTDVIPKPLLPLGEKSLLEHQIEHLKSCNFTDIYLAVNYMADYIQSYLGDGKKLGVNIRYSIEEKPLGTCGPVSLLKNELTEPFLLINGDILTKARLDDIHRFSVEHNDSPFTAATKIITTPFRFSNLKSENDYIIDIEEKPDLHFEILAGIYILKPALFEIIPENYFYGIDDLIKDMLQKKLPITKYLIKDYWVDIGIVEDYETARDLYNEHFK